MSTGIVAAILISLYLSSRCSCSEGYDDDAPKGCVVAVGGCLLAVLGLGAVAALVVVGLGYSWVLHSYQ